MENVWAQHHNFNSCLFKSKCHFHSSSTIFLNNEGNCRGGSFLSLLLGLKTILICKCDKIIGLGILTKHTWKLAYKNCFWSNMILNSLDGLGQQFLPTHSSQQHEPNSKVIAMASDTKALATQRQTWWTTLFAVQNIQTNLVLC